MAQQRLDAPTTTVQPAPGTSPVDLQAEATLAATQGRTEAVTQEIAGQVQQFSANIMKDETMRAAQRDAAKIVSFDADGRPIPDEKDKGLGGLVYNQVYADAALANYRTAALDDLNRRANVALARNPTDPAAVRAELQPYVETTLKSMPAHFAEQMTSHFSGVVNGAMSSASAGKARADITGIGNSIPNDIQSLALDMGRTLASSGWDTVDEKARDATLVSFDQRLKDLADKQRAANVPEATIADTQKALRKQAEAHALGLRLGRHVAADADGSANAYGRALQEVDDFVTQAGNTPFAQQMRDIVVPYIQRAAGIGAAAERANQVNVGRKVARHGIDTITTADQLADGSITFEQANNQLAAINARKATDMMGLRTTDQLAILTAGRGIVEQGLAGNLQVQQAGRAQADANIQNSYAAATTTALGMQANGATQAIQREGNRQLQDIAASPFVDDKAKTEPAYAVMQSQAARGVAEYAAKGMAYDRAANEARIRSGQIDPRFHPEMFAQMQADGSIEGVGGMSVAQAHAMFEEGAQNFAKVQQIRRNANEGRQAWLAGRVVSPAQVQAQRELDRMNGGGRGAGTVADSMGNTAALPAEITQDSVAAELERARGTGIVSEDHVKALAALPNAVDKPTQTAALNLVRGYQQIVRDRMRRNFSDPMALETVVQQLSQQTFGENSMKAVDEYERGYAEATPEQITKAKATLKAERQTNAAGNDPLNVLASISPTARDAVQNPASGFWQSTYRALLSGFGTVSPDITMKFDAFKLETTRALLGSKLPAGTTGDDLVMTGDLAKDLTSYLINDYFPKKKDEDEKAGFDPVEKGSIAYMLARNDRIHARRVTSSDGTESTRLGLDGYADVFRKANANTAAWTDEQIMAVHETRLMHLMPDLYEKIKPGSLAIDEQRSPTGRMLYKAYGTSITGQGTLDLGFVDPKDPGLNALTARIGDSVAHLMDERAANSIFTRLWSIKYRRPELAAELTKELIDLSSAKDLPSQGWTDMARRWRAAVGTIAGVTDEDWSRLANPEIAKALKANGTLSYIFLGRNEIPANVITGVGKHAGAKKAPEIDYGNQNPRTGPAEITQQDEAAAAREAYASRIRRRATPRGAAPDG